LTLVVGASFALFAWRAPRVSPGGRFAFASRETFLLVVSILSMVACASILLGTLYPLAIDTLGLGKISVGAPYFDTVFTPLAVSALFLTGAAINARWKRTEFGTLIRRLRPTFLLALAFGISVPTFFGAWKPLPALGLTLAAWIALSSIQNALTTMRVRASSPHFFLFRRLVDFGGTHVAHVGVAALVAGITLANGYPDEKTFLFAGGETVEFANYAFHFNGVHGENGPNYHAFVADFDLGREGRILRKLLPEKRFYPASGIVMTEAAIDFARDLYVALDTPADRDAPEGAWRVRISRKPFVSWIWGGCALAALGGVLAAFGHCRAEKRRERAKTRASEIKSKNAPRPSSPT
ncbi:MAG: c-type cytochrome biogenesis protein CcmF, partial [Candidatus Accumulibacter sp.]|nr:c-type cytochrome biogenesis protein CcmF [Accumulibacter sp.]